MSRRLRGGMGLRATVKEGLLVAFDSLRANKVRSGLTILGVTIGVMVVLVMAAMVQGLNGSFKDIIASAGPTTFYVFHAPVGGGGLSTGLEEEENEFMRNPPLKIEWSRELARLEPIRQVAPGVDVSDWGYHARRGDTDVRISLYGVDAEYMDMDGGDLVDGRFFTATEESRRRAVAVIDSATAVDLFGGLDPLGKRFNIGRPGQRETPFEAVGVYRPPDNLFAGLKTHYVFAPFASVMKYVRVWDRMVYFVVKPHDGVELEVALEAVRTRMRQLRGLSPGEDDNFYLITQDQVMDWWNKFTGVFFAVMVALSGVGLLVGGVGVIGIMMISVTERTREIGLRKSLGARRRDLLWQFLVEAATLTLLGGAIGMALGGIIVWVIGALTPVPASVPLWSIAVALLASIFTGIGFGLYPAARGAGLDPVDALRYE
ncbi:MAG: ABC transporter permease [Candidatus Palauibacterales bacterium]|nr:ABC transporter permease [Candidatus Palauibacterales bacterium]MDP2482221.1 ABC transporter permease [Candidatus Palauibacterales bacterium]